MKKILLIVGGCVLFVSLVISLAPKGQPQKTVAVTPSSVTAQQLYQKAQQHLKGNDPVASRQILTDLVKNHPDADNISEVQKTLEDVNMSLLLSGIAVPNKTVSHEVVTGDTLGLIAKKYNTTVELIKRCNNLKSDVIRLGQKLRVWTGTFNIFVDKSQNILMLKDGNELIKTYQVSTGENNSTPVGTFKITTKLIDPVWFNRGVVVPPESPQNVLGSRWMGFDLPGYGIHGTVEPETIGQQVTAGCVRMRNEEVEELYSIVPMGTEVTIVD